MLPASVAGMFSTKAAGVFGAVAPDSAAVATPGPSAPGVVAPNPAGVLGAGAAPPNLSGVVLGTPAAVAPATGVVRLASFLITAGVHGAIFGLAGVVGMTEAPTGVMGITAGVCGTTKSFSESTTSSFLASDTWFCGGFVL